MDYNHQFAYCHLKYQSKVDPKDIIEIWNARDGEVPLVMSRKGVEYSQITMEAVPDPEYQWKEGDLVWVDMGKYAPQKVEKFARLRLKTLIKQMTGKPTRKGKSEKLREIKKELISKPVLQEIVRKEDS